MKERKVGMIGPLAICALALGTVIIYFSPRLLFVALLIDVGAVTLGYLIETRSSGNKW